MGAGCSSEQAAATAQAPTTETAKATPALSKEKGPAASAKPEETAAPAKAAAPEEATAAKGSLAEEASTQEEAQDGSGEEKKDQGARYDALKRCFEALDKDKSGTIDGRELKQYLFKSGVTAAQLGDRAADLMAKMDLNCDNLVSLGEFTQMMEALLADKSDEDLEVWVAEVAFTATSRGITGFGNSLGELLAQLAFTDKQVAKLKQVFTTADRDSSGFVELPELKLMLGKSGLDLANTSEEVITLMSKLDKNGDQKISEQEFLVTLSAVRKSLKSDTRFMELLDNLLDVAKDPGHATQKPYFAEVLLAEDFEH